jgi:hypothetical protein
MFAETLDHLQYTVPNLYIVKNIQSTALCSRYSTFDLCFSKRAYVWKFISLLIIVNLDSSLHRYCCNCVAEVSCSQGLPLRIYILYIYVTFAITLYDNESDTWLDNLRILRIKTFGLLEANGNVFSLRMSKLKVAQYCCWAAITDCLYIKRERTI